MYWQAVAQQTEKSDLFSTTQTSALHSSDENGDDATRRQRQTTQLVGKDDDETTLPVGK